MTNTASTISKSIVHLLTVVAVLSSLSGCVHYPSTNEYTLRSMPPGLKAQFDYPKQLRRDITFEKIEEEKVYTTTRYTWRDSYYTLEEMTPNGHKLVFDFYYPKNAEAKVPVVLVMPISGGNNIVARLFSSFFARHGFAAVFVHRQKKYKYFDNVEMIDAILKQMVIDHRQVIDWIVEQPGVDTDRIGSFGISLGGIKNTLISAIDERIKVQVIGLAGSDFPYIIAYSKDPGVKKRRKKLLEKYDVEQEGLRKMIEKHMHYDPALFAQYLDPRQTLMILARYDKSVPYKKGLELIEAAHHPERVFVLSGHYTSIVFLFYIRAVSLRFLAERLGRTDSPNCTLQIECARRLSENRSRREGKRF